ncbi:class I SAM-dependent methyltransferase [Pelagerythrobacter marensis]|uniref:Class I SAM-dependent methyltransferase n=1 Tax=Pelagerythrobacter marensis TaxID=543877 RepID=A0ABZ2D5R2_9SPHN
MQKFEDPGHWDDTARHYETTAHPFTALYAEVALSRVPMGPGSAVLDVAAGTGALALAAARTGARVLATDFSPGMVAAIAAKAVPNVETAVMDGQALSLADGTFDAVFSIFGVIMFPDWRKGLAEMARVTRPGGKGVVATWEDSGAATFLLCRQVCRKLFPGRENMPMPEGVRALGSPDDFRREMIAAGYAEVAIEKVTRDFELELAALDTPDDLFGMSPDWIGLADGEQAAVIAEIRRMAGDRSILPVPSTALVAVARR